MPLGCPKCGLRIGPGDHANALPVEGAIYRCPVCHLALMLDPAAQRMKPVNAADWPSRSAPAPHDYLRLPCTHCGSTNTFVRDIDVTTVPNTATIWCYACKALSYAVPVID